MTHSYTFSLSLSFPSFSLSLFLSLSLSLRITDSHHRNINNLIHIKVTINWSIIHSQWIIKIQTVGEEVQLVDSN